MPTALPVRVLVVMLLALLSLPVGMLLADDAAAGGAPDTVGTAAAPVPVGTPTPAHPDPALVGFEQWRIYTFTITSNGYLAIGLLLACLVMAIISRAMVRNWWLEKTRQTDTLVDDLLAAAFARIFFMGFFAAGVLTFAYFMLQYFIEVGGVTLGNNVGRIALTALYLFILYAAFHLIGVVGQAVKERFGKTATEVDDQLAVLATRLLKGAVCIVGLLMILDLVGAPVTAVLVGLCIVMVLAFLLAFDVLRDVAGSLQLLAAAPFDVGHVVEVDGIVGIVRRIGLRTTALETPERTLVVIPNQQMVRHPVENYTRRTSRRYSYTLELAADTRVSALQATVEAINELLLAEPLVMRRAPKLDAGGDPLTDGDGEVVMQGTDPLVAIEAIEDGAIELLVQYDLTEVSVPKAAPVQQNLVLGVLGALESNGVQFANGSAAGADDTASRADGAATTTTSTATKSASKKATPAAKKKTTPLAKNKSKTTPLKASKSKTMPASPKKRTVTRKTADAGDDDAFV